MTEKKQRNEKPSRIRAARRNAPVGTIAGKIEDAFDLPEGSVSLRKPGGRKKRSDASIKSLRDEWDE